MARANGAVKFLKKSEIHKLITKQKNENKTNLFLAFCGYDHGVEC